MENRFLWFASGLAIAFASSPAFADTCQSLTDSYTQKLTVASDPTQGTDSLNPVLQQIMQLAEQGFDQCQNKQDELGVATLQQAILLLDAQQ